jgi:hypothetical protein
MMYLNEQELVPYQALNYVVAEANYGGRVTDDKDGRLIKAMLKSYFRPEVMNDNFKLSKLDTYYCPPEGTLARLGHISIRCRSMRILRYSVCIQTPISPTKSSQSACLMIQC